MFCQKNRSHSLDELTGYVVVQTVAGDRMSDPLAPVVAVIDNPRRFADAVDLSRKIRRVRGSWSLVRNLYGCPACDVVTLLGGEPHREAARLAVADRFIEAHARTCPMGNPEACPACARLWDQRADAHV